MAVVDPINKSWCLAQVCETNYQKLLYLIPDLFSIEHQARGTAPNKTALQLNIVERNPFTLTIELNHCFDEALDVLMLPALKVRVYQDAKSAEVLRDHVRSDVSSRFKNPGESVAIMEYKWRLNYFLSKWLDHCLSVSYHFQSDCVAELG